MSFNHLKSDSCTYARSVKENVSMLEYILSPDRFEHKNKCFHQLGLVGGTAVSHITGNMVDLESDLRGQTQHSTKCQPIRRTKDADLALKHLPKCQMITYPAVSLF